MEDSVFEVAGAINIKSAHSANSTLSFQTGLSRSVAVKVESTGFFDSVAKVSGVTKSFAEGVITTLTSAPC